MDSYVQFRKITVFGRESAANHFVNCVEGITIMANFFVLTGHDLNVTYRIGGNPGFIALTYKTPTLNEGFKPAQIETVSTSLGNLVTVAIRTTIDTGGTTFSFFLPDISVPLGSSVKFTTIGIYKDVNGPIILPKDVKVSWRTVPLEGTAESIIVPF